MFKSQLRPSAAASASVPDTSRETESEMEISVTSDVAHQPLTTSPSRRPAAVTTTASEDPVSDQFQQMRSMISSFFWFTSRPYSKSKTVFLQLSPLQNCIPGGARLLTFRNETVKLLSGIQYKAEERKRQVTKTQQVTTFQLSEATQATAVREYIPYWILNLSPRQLCGPHR